MNLNALHRRLLQDVLEIGNAFPFVITGGYAVQAHGLRVRPSAGGHALGARTLPRRCDRHQGQSPSGSRLPRDLVDIHAASKIRSQTELESLGSRCAWDEFSLEGLATRLGSVLWRADEEFSAYGLSEGEIANLRRWAQAWSDDINRRLYAESYADDGDDELA